MHLAAKGLESPRELRDRGLVAVIAGAKEG
jgi:hypothetical protein